MRGIRTGGVFVALAIAALASAPSNASARAPNREQYAVSAAAPVTMSFAAPVVEPLVAVAHAASVSASGVSASQQTSDSELSVLRAPPLGVAATSVVAVFKAARPRALRCTAVHLSESSRLAAVRCRDVWRFNTNQLPVVTRRT